MSVATLTPKQEELAKEAQAALEAHAVRKVGYIEQARMLFSNVNGTGRTAYGIALGKLLSDSLAEERNIPNKKKWMAEMAKQICGAYSDDRKLIEYVKLFHISLRVPVLAELGLTWSLKCISSMKTGFDWKSVTDDMPSAHIERAQHIMPLLHAGTDGIGCDDKGNPSRKLWAKIIGHYVEHGELPTEKSEADAQTTEQPIKPLDIATVAEWIKAQADLTSLVDALPQDQVDRLFDAIDVVSARRLKPTETK